ncbi:hypothetical protein FE257_006034 [Aspergillus nanangensis]|uniref:Cytochrome P450 n=1 Tax=Aspergillus nanangensis TaxID=2582783 RepID=A0AAD4GV23_ASPNN|nr:hypothetical protein FE257_006034 [Aspergillus nanangensis]
MDHFLSLLTITAIIYILYSCATIISDRRNAKRLGCQPAHTQKNRLPLGIDQLQRLRKADQAGLVPEEYANYFAQEGRRTFRASMLGSTFVQTIEPKNIQALLATQFKDFELGDLRRRIFFPFLGNGIFTADGSLWEHSRAMLRPQFVREQVADLDLEETHVQTLLQLLVPTDANGWTASTNITPMFFRLTFDSATEFFFGTSVNSQRQAFLEQSGHAPTEAFEWKDLARCFDAGTKHLGDRGHLMEFYWLHNPQDFRDSIKEVNRFADYCVQQALARAASPQLEEEKGKKRKYTFLDELVKATTDPIELRSQLLNILLAGRDTTASLLSWTFWLLAAHPGVFHKLRSAVLADFGPYAHHTETITFTALKSCTYLQHVMNEVLRLYPPVPMNSRRATRDTTLPLGGGVDGKSPIYVRKNEEVGYYVCVMHRLKELWGEDADEFRPDRWASRRNGWDYLPFNGGPRICLGQQFALTEAGYVIVRLLQRFDRLALGDKDAAEPPRHRLGVTDAPQDYMIYLHEAE